MHYVVSDLHGHVDPLLGALRRAGLLGSDDVWSGGRAILTFMGDYFDRGPDGIAVVDLIRRLQDESAKTGGRVEAMIGNHEILALGMSRFGAEHVPSGLDSPRSFARSWALNGGQTGDQRGLTDDHIDWLSGLDSVVLTGADLLLHSDTSEYLRWGDSAGQINDAVREVLAGEDLEQWWQCWVRLTTRYAFAGPDGADVAAGLLDQLGGERIVHGHSVISTFSGQAPGEVAAPLAYAGGRVLAVDGGVYGGGPCLVIRLDPDLDSDSTYGP